MFAADANFAPIELLEDAVPLQQQVPDSFLSGDNLQPVRLQFRRSTELGHRKVASPNSSRPILPAFWNHCETVPSGEESFSIP